MIEGLLSLSFLLAFVNIVIVVIMCTFFIIFMRIKKTRKKMALIVKWYLDMKIKSQKDFILLLTFL